MTDCPILCATSVAISIRQPWCHHILHDGKDIENRSWKTTFRGQVLIHASSNVEVLDRAEVQTRAMPLGGIVGVMEIVDCVTDWHSDWFCGPFGFVIRNARPLPFVPCRGKLGFFRVDEAVLAGLRRNIDQMEG